MYRLILAILVSLSLLACQRAVAPPPTVLQDDSPANHIEYPEPQGTHYEIPTQVIDKLPPTAGKDADDIVAVVSVPATTVTTYIKIYKKHKTVRQTIFPTKEEPRRPVSVVSNNPGVLVASPEVTPWWVIAISIVSGLLVTWQGISSIFGVISGPLSIIRKLIGK
jgi:hypothetical protein